MTMAVPCRPQIRRLPTTRRRRELIFDGQDRNGEYSIVGCERRYEFWTKYETFADYLAHYFGLWSPD